MFVYIQDTQQIDIKENLLTLLLLLLFEFSSGNRSMAILEDRQLDFGYTIHFKFSLLISIVIAQRI